MIELCGRMNVRGKCIAHKQFGEKLARMRTRLEENPHDSFAQDEIGTLESLLSQNPTKALNGEFGLVCGALLAYHRSGEKIQILLKREVDEQRGCNVFLLVTTVHGGKV